MKTTFEHDGFTVKITVHDDFDMRAPWQEHDGHGPVSEWRRVSSKRPGERILSTDRQSARFYDIEAATQIAKRDGWGIAPDKQAKIEASLGRKMTRGEIAAAAVEHDFEYLRGWANDEWHWLGYTTEIETPDGQTIDGDSCWGFDGVDGGEYMVAEASEQARATIADLQALERETMIAACVP